MTETQATGGLFGLLGRAMSGAKSGATAAKQSTLFDPLHWIVRATLAAGMILVYKKAQANPEWTDAAVAMLLGFAALLCEYFMGGEIIRAWVERSLTRVAAAAGVYVFALGFAFLQWTGTASEMEADKAGLQQSRFEQATTARSDKEALFAKKTGQAAVVERLKVERWKPLPTVGGNPVSSADEATTIIDRLKTNTRYWILTEGCKVTKGPDTRKYCSELKEAEAAIAASQTREALAPTLKDAEAKLDKMEADYKAASAAVTNGPVAVSGKRADLHMLMAYGGLSEQAAMDLSAFWKIMIISVLAFVLGMMTKAREYRDVPRKPWGIAAALLGVINGISRALFGRNVIGTKTVYVDDREAIARMEAARSALGRYAPVAQ